jgi:uncharacterized Zn-finger protein
MLYKIHLIMVKIIMSIIEKSEIICCGDDISHPKIYLKIDNNAEVRCPYCFATYKNTRNEK